MLGKGGVIPTLCDIFGPGGQKLLDSLELPQPYASRVDSQRRLLLMLDNGIDLVEHELHHRLKDDAGYQALLRISPRRRLVPAVRAPRTRRQAGGRRRPASRG